MFKGYYQFMFRKKLQSFLLAFPKVSRPSPTRARVRELRTWREYPPTSEDDDDVTVTRHNFAFDEHLQRTVSGMFIFSVPTLTTPPPLSPKLAYFKQIHTQPLC